MSASQPRTVQFAARLASPIAERLRARAAARDQSQRQPAERYIDEGLRMDDHPGVVFRDGPMGRRAGLAAGPDVWEILTALKRMPTRGSPAIKELSVLLDLTEEQLQTALDYYGEFPDEIDELIQRNEKAAERAERIWAQQRSALG